MNDAGKTTLLFLWTLPSLWPLTFALVSTTPHSGDDYSTTPTCVNKYRLPHTPTDEIRIGVLLPFQGPQPWVIHRTFPAIKMAVESIQNQTDMLRGYTIQLNSADSNCSETIGPLAAIDMYLNQSAHVFLGPACAYAVAPIARFSFSWGIPVVTAGALVSALKDKSEYRLLTRVQGTHAKVSEFILNLFQSFEWENIALLYNDNKNSQSERQHCYFSVEPVFHGLRDKKANPWAYEFDERSGQRLQWARMLREASNHARSESLVI
ncbi:atrial natriuretic peptide receptor 1 [Aplysia californica]|uniref:Atrial natriuretic peptide receptor 1 n=1 Tax=Aplysia californica TaxID=6500 RepID=A0ABM0KB82_APLCA|nr:atrial natriuretic peptide receptor 1 [Aplysia californica]